MDIPVTANTKQLSQLTNTLEKPEHAVPYAFYVGNTEIKTDLHTILTQQVPPVWMFVQRFALPTTPS